MSEKQLSMVRDKTEAFIWGIFAGLSAATILDAIRGIG